MREMAAADLCDECKVGRRVGALSLVYNYKGGGGTRWITCPNCTHQTPAERVMEAAEKVAHRIIADNMVEGRPTWLIHAQGDGFFRYDPEIECLLEALAALNGGQHD